MIEVFDEIAGDTRAVEDLKVWLLKQKQARDWRTTKATADAVYALLLRGTDLLGGEGLVEVELGGVNLTSGVAEPTDQVRGRPSSRARDSLNGGFAAAEVTPLLGRITVRKGDAGVAWAACTGSTSRKSPR